MTLKNKVAEMLELDPKLTAEDIASALGVSAKAAAAAVLQYRGNQIQDFDARGEIQLQIDIEKQKTAEQEEGLVEWTHAASESRAKLEELAGTSAPAQIFDITTSNKIGSETVPVLVLSDWLVERKVKPEATMNLNQYDLEIGEKRVHECVQKFVKLITLRRLTNTNIDTGIIYLAGGFIDGKPGERNPETSPTDAAIIATSRLYSALKFILKHGGFKKIIVPCTAGSYSSTLSKKDIALGNPYEWCIYAKLTKLFKGEKRIQFIVPRGQHIQVRVFGKILRLHYGDSINYRDGIGGITIPLMKRINAWNVGKEAYMDIFGKWRAYSPDRKFVGNGSLIGYTETDAASAKEFEKPMQSLIYLEKTKGLTSYEPLYVKTGVGETTGAAA
jgi:hypothetical protein